MSDQGSGLNTMDFMSMPGPMRRLLRMMLKKPVISYSELCKLVDEMPEGKRISRDELDETLKELLAKKWLTKDSSESEEDLIYKINLGSKEGSDQSRDVVRSTADTRPRKREGPRMKDLWNAVDTTSDTDYRKRHSEDLFDKTAQKSNAAKSGIADPPEKKSVNEESHKASEVKSKDSKPGGAEPK